ncbi:hypothetical protein BH10BAC2_BH10BAC2_47750 [soil metagenome]
MQDCFQIRTSEELIDYLRINENIDVYDDFGYQLQTNYGFVYNLKSGQVVFLPNNFRGDGILFLDEKCFKHFVAADKFPIDNPGNNLYDTEIDRIKTINKQIDFYRIHLNTVLKFDFEEISHDAAQAYIKKVVGRTIKKLTTNTDLVGLIAVFGELIRIEIGGKWVIEKWYGTYNPRYKPRILTKDKKLIFIDDTLIIQLKWKVTQIDSIFKNTEGVVDLKTRRQHHQCDILKD